MVTSRVLDFLDSERSLELTFVDDVTGNGPYRIRTVELPVEAFPVGNRLSNKRFALGPDCIIHEETMVLPDGAEDVEYIQIDWFKDDLNKGFVRIPVGVVERIDFSSRIVLAGSPKGT